jgi:hypothetical protein
MRSQFSDIREPREFSDSFTVPRLRGPDGNDAFFGEEESSLPLGGSGPS